MVNEPAANPCLLCEKPATHYLIVVYHRGAHKKRVNLPVCEQGAFNSWHGADSLVEKEKPKGYVFSSYAPIAIAAFEHAARNDAVVRKWKNRFPQTDTKSVKVRRDTGEE